MLSTPVDFIPLITPEQDLQALTFLFHRDALLLRDDGLELPDAAACAALGVQADWHAVGRLRGQYCRTGWLPQEVPLPPGFSLHKLRALFGALPDDLMGVAARACQIAEWARTHRYCGACATPTLLLAGERCLQCPSCGHVAYPRISPAMMVLVRKGDAILLAQHAAAPAHRYSPLAGFLEAGESVEEAVHREVFEEVGLQIGNLNYFGSQAWPFPHSLMIAFTADYVAGDIIVDQREITEARWFGPGDVLPDYTKGISISSLLIDAHLPARSVR